MTSRLHKAALKYAAMGWAVFPQASGGKHPLTVHGHKNASTDPAMINAWWGETPEANIGVSVEASGLFVVDVDCKDGKPNGHEALARLLCEHGDFSLTVEARSGAYAAGRGRHFVFRTFPGCANTDGRLGAGIETKARGAFTVCPSLHRSGATYEWVNPPSRTDVADAPAWLVSWFAEQDAARAAAAARLAALPKADPSMISDRYAARALDDEVSAVAKCSGNRAVQLNVSAFKLGQLVGAGILKRGDAEAALLRAAADCGLVKDDGPKEVYRIISGGVADGFKQPRQIPELRAAAPRSIKPAAPAAALRVIVQEAPEPTPIDDRWRDDLVLNENGGLKRQSFANAALLVRNLLRGLFVTDDFSQTTIITDRPPWALNGWGGPVEVQDNDTAGLRLWLERQGVAIGDKDAYALINYVAGETHIHPVRDYLAGLKWDGTPRIDTWLEDYLDAPSTAFHRAAAAKFMIAAVARVTQPGCKFDNMLVLEGDQALGKSTALSALFGEDWTSTGSNLFDDNKRMVMLMSGSWCVEIAELAAVKGRKVEQVKALITVADDKAVLMYAKRASRHRRQCVFVGTVNPGADLSYLEDETGARRFWPVPVGRIDVAGIRADRDQLWAEAVARYRGGEQWWITDEAILEEARSVQAARIGSDPWMDSLLEHRDLLARDSISPSEVYDRLNIPNAQRQKGTQMRIASCLKHLGFERKDVWLDGRKTRIWSRQPDVQ